MNPYDISFTTASKVKIIVKAVFVNCTKIVIFVFGSFSGLSIANKIEERTIRDKKNDST